MQILFKVIRLIATMCLVLNASQLIANNTTQLAVNAVPANTTVLLNTEKFKSKNDQIAYALGVSLGYYMGNSLKEQEKLGVKLDKDQLIAGIQDIFLNKSKLSSMDVNTTLQGFEAQIKAAAQVNIEQEARENESKGIKYRNAFAKEKGVKKTTTGLLYQVEKAGVGAAPKESDTITVNYRGTLINGVQFDSSYTRGAPLTLRLDSVIPGWTEGLKQIGKEGKIKLVIPPTLAYGKTEVPGIPVNSTLVFYIDLLDVKASLAVEGKKIK